MERAATNELRLRCVKCEREWVAAKLPMEISDLVKLTRRAKCECGASRKDLVLPFARAALKGGET